MKTLDGLTAALDQREAMLGDWGLRVIVMGTCLHLSREVYNVVCLV